MGWSKRGTMAGGLSLKFLWVLSDIRPYSVSNTWTLYLLTLMQFTVLIILVVVIMRGWCAFHHDLTGFAI